MHNLKLAAQLYTLRDHLKTPEDFAASMRKVSEIGYRAVQISGIGPISDEIVKQVADSNGLTICNTHANFDLLRQDPDSVIAQHRLWECRHVAVGSMPNQYREDEAGYRRFVADAVAVGRRLADSGMSFSYHNHSFEFVRFGNRSGLEIIFEESDPRYLMAEIDTYWVQHGGDDPVAWIRCMKDRMPIVHFKDMSREADSTPYMTEVGEGILDWPAIIEACRDIGVEWAAVEQDICRRDPFESLAISHRNLVNLGLS